MAGAERIAASAITATASRPPPSPLRNFRPAFEDIMLTGSSERAAVPQKLAAALGSLMESARERGVEAQVDGILRMYASEIKNDIVLLTISRLRDMVQSLPPERLGPRLNEIPHLMREFPQAADTVPEIVMNAERLQGGGRLGLEQMRKMMRSVVGRSRSLCPRELFTAIKSDYESGRFDSIAGVAEARTGAAPREAAPEFPQRSQADQAAAPLNAPQPEEAALPRFAASAQEVPDCLHARPEMVWCDEVKARKSRRDESGPVFESVAYVVRGEKEAERKAEMRAELTARERREAAAPEARLLRPAVLGARAAEAEAREGASRPAARKHADAKQDEWRREEASGRAEARKAVAPKAGDAPKLESEAVKAETPRKAAIIARGRARIARRVILSPAMAINNVRRAISAMASRSTKPKRAPVKRPAAEMRAGRKADDKRAGGRADRPGAHGTKAKAASGKVKNAKDAARAKAAKALERKKLRREAAGREPGRARATGAAGAGRRRQPKEAVSEKRRFARKRPGNLREGGPRMKSSPAKMHPASMPGPAPARRRAPGDGQGAARRKKGGAARMALLGLWSGVRPWRRRALKSALPALRWPAARS